MKFKLTFICDMGASLTKITFLLLREGFAPVVALKTPCNAVQPITYSRYESKQRADDNTALVHFEDDYWMVGDAARQRVTITNVRTPKHRHAIAKVLGGVGQILQEYGYDETADELHIDVGLLLPLDETKRSDALVKRLREALYEFGHNGKQIKCTVVDEVQVSPEGYGYSQFMKRSPFIVVMVGHRDAACVYVRNGSVLESESRALPGWGMVKLIDMINYPFKDEMGAAEAIFAVGDVYSREKPLLKVVPSEDVGVVLREIKEARRLVWNLFWDELTDSHIRKVDQVYAAGGNALYWKPELREALGSSFSMGGELLSETQKRFPELKNPRNASLTGRCADCYAFLKALAGDRLPALEVQAEPVEDVAALVSVKRELVSAKAVKEVENG